MYMAMKFYSKARFLSREGACTIVYHTMARGLYRTMVRDFVWLWNGACTGFHEYGTAMVRNCLPGYGTELVP